MKKNYSKPTTEMTTVAQTNLICASPEPDKRINVKDKEGDTFNWDEDVN